MNKPKRKDFEKLPPDEGRRKLFRDIGIAAVSAVLARPMDNVCKLVAGLVDTAALTGKRTALQSVVNVNRGIQVFAGNTNKLAAAEGRPGLSPYLKNSAKLFSAFAVTALGDAKRFENVSDEDAWLALDTIHSDLILLGGPVANNLGAKFTAHGFVTVRELDKDIQLPMFNPGEGLRWGFYCGRDAYGAWEGRVQRALRYEGGHQVDRPLYGLWDLNDSADNPRPFIRDENGFLREEALLVTRRPSPYTRDGSITTIGGVHGYSAQAFFCECEANLEHLSSKTENAKRYQVMIPVRLVHDHSKHHTRGVLDWSRAAVSEG